MTNRSLAALSTVFLLGTGATPGQEPAAVSVDASAGTVAVQAEPTFTEHIAPIIFNNCTSCHRPGEGAPFTLMNYKQVRRRARMIVKVTKSRFMPPWHPVEGHGEFAGARRLQPEQIAMLEKWHKTGMKAGDPKKLPPMPKFTEGWQLGEPDLIVKMPKGFTVPAGGPDIYRNFVVPVGLQEDKWVTAIEVRPSARTVLHHIIFGVDTSGSARREDGRDGRPGFSGMRGRRASRGRSVGTSTSGLGGWAVGGTPRHLPMGLARELPKGSDLILRSHFHPSGKREVEQTTLGLYFTDKPPTRTMVGLQLPPRFGFAAGLNIPAGEKNFKIGGSYTLPVDVQGLTVGGHAHYLCKTMRVLATLPNGQTKSIFYIDNWAFNWQNRYQYKKPLDLPRGTKIDVSITYDNSKDNPSNPNDPPRRVRWGPQSTDEMGSVTLLMVAKRERDTRRLKRMIRAAARESMSQGVSGIAGAFISRIMRLDKNNNGKLEASEIPSSYKRILSRLDANRDGTIDEKELKELENSTRRRRDR